ncbi:Neural-cadherin [Portunus trituberculatus]|uniref:Neural-cadherin n=1 Tax=Portunus trituberculatus TaxID=210409 RepID=A0A5B7CHB5_PORTR|nr:Neural-cadherin [Portunus trituberculatus]
MQRFCEGQRSANLSLLKVYQVSVVGAPSARHLRFIQYPNVTLNRGRMIMVLELVIFLVGGYLGALVMQRFSADLPVLPDPTAIAIRIKEFFTLSVDELRHKYGGHELVVAAEGVNAAARALIMVQVTDVNDNPPVFLQPEQRLTVVEEDDRDLPATITRALDRDPPYGMSIWRLRVEVRDGKWQDESQEGITDLSHDYTGASTPRQVSWGHRNPDQGPDHTKRTAAALHLSDSRCTGGRCVSNKRKRDMSQQGISNRKTRVVAAPDDKDIHHQQGSTRAFWKRSRVDSEWLVTNSEAVREEGFGLPGEGKQSLTLCSSPCQHNNTSTHLDTGDSGSTTTFISGGDPITLVSAPEKPHRIHSDPSGHGVGLRERRDVSSPSSNSQQDDGGCSVMGTSLREISAGDGEGKVHVAETVVTVVVKDINDNAPVFPNATMLGQVQENVPAGSAVVVVSAWDADDATDGSNARLTYAIEKNVVDEASGAAIFSVEPDTGLVRTERCCLDREATPEYRLQVVAADGGGLKGTGTVVVRVVDQNDNPPRLARRSWEVEVQETPRAAPLANTTLLELTAVDKDASATLHYRVEPRSGLGWDMFGVRSSGSSGQLFALRSLDYEQESHRRGFKFRVQVTDQGPLGWEDLSHVDSAWVTVRVKDVNDNPPLFSHPHAHVSVREDAVRGTLLATLPAHDPDAGGQQSVQYSLEGGWDALDVDAYGNVTLRRQLDREAPGGDVSEALIVAVDGDHPPRSATATLTISVEDVNDCPPAILPPTLLHVTEGSPPSLLGVLKATDPDVWALGHGPPFTLSLAPTNPSHILSLINLKFDPRLDSGRGGAELWTAGAVDREQHRQLSVAVQVSDAQGLSATYHLTVLVDDLNDNPMKPATKAVYLWKTQGGGFDAPLGRVFVEDPDDWDLEDKEFEWAGPPHPLFTLQPHDGTIMASSSLREGRYELQFSVSDRAWQQRGVAANVTVTVRILTPEALAHAAPLVLTPITPTDLTRGWFPTEGGGLLGSLLKTVQEMVGALDYSIQVVSVYDGCSDLSTTSHLTPQRTPLSKPATLESSTPTSTCVWLSVKDTQGGYMNLVKLQGLLALHTRQSVVMMVDQCGKGWTDQEQNDVSCLVRARWRASKGNDVWVGSAPLQVGGLAQAPPRPEDHGWREAPTHHHLTGCLSRFTINTQVMDLGEVANSYDSVTSCPLQDTACPQYCGLRGRCVGGLQRPRCECDPGWTGSGCSTPTVPARFKASSYLKVALSFSPDPWTVRVQVRLRLRGARSAQLQAGVPCATVSGAGWAAQRVCVERRPLGDGTWHTVAVERHGHNLLVSVDDGDGWRRNETLASLTIPGVEGPPPPLTVDKHNGVTVGGLPEFTTVDLVTVHDDLQDTVISVVLSLGLRRFRRGRENLAEPCGQGCSGIVTAEKSEAGSDGIQLELINLKSSKVLSNHMENNQETETVFPCTGIGTCRDMVNLSQAVDLHEMPFRTLANPQRSPTPSRRGCSVGTSSHCQQSDAQPCRS